MSTVQYALGSDKYLRALLLNEENYDAPFTELAKIDIHPHFSFIQALLEDGELVNAVDSERGRLLRDCLHISICALIVEEGLTSGQLLQLFDALQIPVEDSSFGTGVDEQWLSELVSLFGSARHGEIVRQARKSGFLLHLTIWLCSWKEFTEMFDDSIASGTSNLLLLSEFDLLDTWARINPERFLELVPSHLASSFIPHTRSEYFLNVDASDQA